MRVLQGQCRHQIRQRSGAMMIIMMICLLLVSLLGASMLKLSFAMRNQSRQEQIRLQATWLAESGIERAAAVLSENKDYEGEEWQLAGDGALGGKPGTVKIKVDLDSSVQTRRFVRVVADYPSDTDQRARITKAVLIDL